jgi:hypothetical protein
MVDRPIQVPGMVASLYVAVAVPQLSVTVGIPVTAGELSVLHSIEGTVGGKLTNAGDSVSLMVTTWSAVMKFPLASVNVQTMMVVPWLCRGIL